MSLRIACDIDGVVADMDGALRRVAATALATSGRDAPGDEPAEHPLALTAAEQRGAWRAARQRHNFWETLEPLERGVLPRLRQLSLERRWHVVFLTQRPTCAGDSVQIQTQRWLHRHGFDHASVLIVPGTRGQLATALGLDVAIDDVPKYCLDVKIDSRARACLIWRHDESALPPGTRNTGLEVFPSLSACLDLLETLGLERRSARPPRLAGALLRRLGLAPPQIS